MDHTKRYIEDCEATIARQKAILAAVTGLVRKWREPDSRPDDIDAAAEFVAGYVLASNNCADELEQETRGGE